MSPQSLNIPPSPSPILGRHVLSRWTDDDLLHVLRHANGNFEMAIDKILRHEATGQPPENLIRHFSEGEVRNISGSLRSSTRTGSVVRPIVLDDNVSMCHNVSLGTMTHALLSTPLFESERLPPLSTSRFERVPMQQLNALAVRQPDELLLQISSRSKHRQPDADVNAPDSTPKTLKRQQRPLPAREFDMLNMQTSIEASLTTTTTHIDLEDEAVSHAVKVSKETFDEEFKRMELRNAIEMKQIKILLAKSLTDPVMMSEEELITKAMAESLADPVKKSEEQLIEEARELSLRDPIKKSEEQLLEEALRQSLFQEMHHEENRVEAVKCQPFTSLSESAGKKPSRWSFTEEDLMLECSMGNDSPPSALDFSLTSFGCKMSARSLAETQTFGNDLIESFVSNIDVAVQVPESAEHITGEDSGAAYDDALNEDLHSLSTDWGPVE